LDKLKVRDLEIVQGGQMTLPQGQDEIVGQGIVAISSDYAIIENSKISQQSKIFISFTANLNGASWWVCDKIESQSFKVCLSQPAQESLTFDYWIVQTKTAEQAEQIEETVSPVVDEGSSSSEATDSETADTGTIPADGDSSEDSSSEETAASEQSDTSEEAEKDSSQEEFPQLPLSPDINSDEQIDTTPEQSVPESSPESVPESVNKEVVVEEAPVAEPEPVSADPEPTVGEASVDGSVMVIVE